jgi:hypothetical protein
MVAVLCPLMGRYTYKEGMKRRRERRRKPWKEWTLHFCLLSLIKAGPLEKGQRERACT